MGWKSLSKVDGTPHIRYGELYQKSLNCGELAVEASCLVGFGPVDLYF
jgi:hypothetical protein